MAPSEYVGQGTPRNPEAVAPRHGTYRGSNVEFRGEEFPAEEHPLYGTEGYEPEYDEDAERAKVLERGTLQFRKPRSAPRPGDPRLRGSRSSDAPPNSEGYPPYFDSDVEDSAHNQPRPAMPRDIFGKAWDSLLKRSYIENRPKRLAQAKVQRLARKTKTRKTKARYARALSRGNVRPRMRRQTGLVRVSRKR
tara:strand:+ start:699 stop:1277 length:579 start_codon:yes stop_codon:yes gene_type:complete